MTPAAPKAAEPATESGVQPVLVLPETVVFPKMTLQVLLYEDRELALFDDVVAPPGKPAPSRPRFVLCLCQWDCQYPKEAEPNPVGTLCEVLEWDDQAGDRNLLARGIERVQIVRPVRTDPYLIAEVERLEGRAWKRPVRGAHSSGEMKRLKERAQQIAFGRKPEQAKELLNTLEWIDDPATLSDYVAQHFVADWYLKQELLEMTDPAERVRTLLDVLRDEGK